jgi:hypothetical protein
VVSSSDHPGEVYRLPDAIRLGSMCDDLNQPVEVRPAAGSDVAACVSKVGISFYRIPDGPLPKRGPAGSRALTATAGGTPVRAVGGALQVGTNSAVPVVSGRITAVAASGDGTRVVIGSSSGDSAVATIHDGALGVITRNRIPTQRPVTDAGWHDGPFVTAGAESWRVPDCGRCDTDAGLLDAFRARITGCFIERQLQWIDAGTRHALNIRECAEQIGG